MSGYIKLYRGWHDNNLFGANEPYCPRSAWVWLLSNAAWKDTQRIGPQGNLIDVKEGQYHTSLRNLAAVWGWDKNRVDRFLKRATKCGNIGTSASQGGLLITICNWQEYQSKRDKRGTSEGTSAGQARDTQEERKERKEEKEKKEEGRGGYAFHGVVVKLRQAHYDQWQEAFPNLDLRAQLTSRDAWLSDQQSATQKKWFNSTAAWLAKKQQETRAVMERDDDPMANFIT